MSALTPTAHVEVFERKVLVYSSRPDEFLARSCVVCGGRLGSRKRIRLFGSRSAHEDCTVGREPLPKIAGGASTAPFEGLDQVIQRISSQAWWLRLFTSQTATSTPSPDSKLTGAAAAPYTLGSDPPVESVGASYAGLEILPSAWDPTILTINGIARRLVGPDLLFAETTDDWGIINGYFLADVQHSTGQNTAVALFYANFDSGTPVILNGPGFTLQVTPYIELDTIRGG